MLVVIFTNVFCFLLLDDSEITQFLSSVEGPFGKYILLEVVHEAIRFKKKSILNSLRSHSQFGPKMEKILLANNLNEDGMELKPINKLVR